MRGPKQELGFWYRFVASIVRPILMVLTKRQWRGAEHIPSVGTGVVVAPNHLSHIDPLTFAHFLWDNGRAPRFLGKESVFRVPIVGRIILACGQIPVYRESRDAAKAYRSAVEAVERGECVGVYPEGTITRDPDLWPMSGKTGAARIALSTGCDVIPVAQWGPNELLGPYSKRPRLFPRKTMYVSAGPPVDLTDLVGQPISAKLLEEASERIMDAITAQLAELRGEEPPAVRYNMRRRIGPPRHGDVEPEGETG